MSTLTILIPCLNESETLEICIRKAKYSLESLQIDGEVLVADNGSIDDSQAIAEAAGARVIHVSQRGYGAALIAGIASSRTDFILMGDADDSYALDDIGVFVAELENGFDLVMGNRFKGGISPGAMPWLHKYLGNPVLSWIGKVLFKVPIGDFHCGLRAFRTSSIRNLKLKSTGMEFASEMVVKASIHGLRIAEVPTTLKPDGRSRPPHLRTWRDGWRHLIFLLMSSPRFLFFYPGMFLFIAGLLGVSITFTGGSNVLNLYFSSNTYLLSIGIMLVGTQTIILAILARIFSYRLGILPENKYIEKFKTLFTLEIGIILGLILTALGICGFVTLLFNWNGVEFENISVGTALRISGAIIFAILSGVQILFASFFASMIQSS